MEEWNNQRKKKVRKKEKCKLHLERRREKRNKRGDSLSKEEIKAARKKENEKENIKEKGDERENNIKIFSKRNVSIPNTHVFGLWFVITQPLTKTSSSRHGTGKSCRYSRERERKPLGSPRGLAAQKDTQQTDTTLRTSLGAVKIIEILS